ncbi:helix-turn-helix domain-containing protein [Sinorhizobium mexicanum]|uniref:Uncharacterized protein n=1 Tax=Sinorhizobium mexicanum TaxID=375549 RepID=A0A859QPV5_9HYPH|nr:helix-turn-helix transcriptional regulator [Sinorhizobium mexicanum]MBP1888245.1 DNA-binding CsgD family transcriptional regulator [Sinorhizobium mexicanum]QLL64117.1 hypothetical protein FKV68_21970 [Sinorhizobium mexicanum]
MLDNRWTRLIADSRDEWFELGFHRKAVFDLHGEHDPILSAREVESLRWSALGKGSKDVAVILGRSEHTIQTYLKTARFKLQNVTISAAIARVIQPRLTAIME